MLLNQSLNRNNLQVEQHEIADNRQKIILSKLTDPMEIPEIKVALLIAQ